MLLQSREPEPPSVPHDADVIPEEFRVLVRMKDLDGRNE
jgi:hypothetical protein